MGRHSLILETTDTGCIIPVSHKLNQDGYFRKRINDRLVMYHRYVWEQNNGEIPKDFEIDHICMNRACSNIEHLRCISREEHLKHTNQSRNLERLFEACLTWVNNPKITGTKLASIHGVSFSIGCRWVRLFKKVQEEQQSK